MLDIKVIGSGCMNCNHLEELCKQVILEEDLDANIEKITNVEKFSELGIFMTPGLIINNEVVSSGKVPDKITLKRWLLERL